MTQQLQNFELWKSACEEEKEEYLDWGSPILNKSLRGARGGSIILIAGAANNGKSQLMTNLVVKLLRNNSDTVVLDFTLDDSINKRLTQYIASISQLEMNTIDFINNEINNEIVTKFQEGSIVVMNWIKDELLHLYDIGNDKEDQSSIVFIKRKVEEFRKNYPDKKLVVCLDALNDVEVPGVTAEKDFAKSEMISKYINKLAITNNAIVMATSHLRKNGSKRPNLEDLKGNNYLAFTAKVVIGVHNDIKINKGKAKVFWSGKTSGGEVLKMPIVEAHFLKNKVSDFNGVICYLQWPAQARLKEAEDQKKYSSLIYGEV